MRHPAWGVVPPAYFIPDEGDPHFHALSEFVIGRAVEDWRYLVEQKGPVDLSINLPISFLADDDAVHALCRQVPDHPAFSGLLIEIDSGEIIDNLDLAIDVARRVRLHNIAISIDNVGANWPSLLGLPNFPFVELKVDHQFVTGCADQRLRQTVCRRIVELAHDNGARVVAQGIESRADFLAAHDLDFDLVQGYLFGKPMGVKKFARSRLQLLRRKGCVSLTHPLHRSLAALRRERSGAWRSNRSGPPAASHPVRPARNPRRAPPRTPRRSCGPFAIRHRSGVRTLLTMAACEGSTRLFAV